MIISRYIFLNGVAIVLIFGAMAMTVCPLPGAVAVAYGCIWGSIGIFAYLTRSLYRTKRLGLLTGSFLVADFLMLISTVALLAFSILKKR